MAKGNPIPPGVPKTANVEWFDALVRHQVYLQRVSGTVRDKVNALLNATERDMAVRIKAVLAGDKKMSPARLRKAERLIKQLKAIRTPAWEEADKLWQESMKELTVTEVRQIRTILRTVVPVELDVALPAAAKLKALVTASPFEGRTLSSWARDVKRADLERIEAQVRIGIVQGEGSQTIARRVVGTVNRRGIDGTTQITRNQAGAITRTAINHFSNQAREMFFDENEDIFGVEVFVATLDGRTTPICRSLDGKRFKVGEGAIPPMHFACRSLRVAEINGQVIGERPEKPVTQRLLVKEYAQQEGLGKISNRAHLPRGHKGQFDSFAGRRTREMTGRLPAKVTYQEWLTRQSVEFQDDVLGPTRGRLFRTGKIKLDKFVDRTGEQLNLSELADREAAAFRAAGLDPADY